MFMLDPLKVAETVQSCVVRRPVLCNVKRNQLSVMSHVRSLYSDSVRTALRIPYTVRCAFWALHRTEDRVQGCDLRRLNLYEVSIVFDG